MVAIRGGSVADLPGVLYRVKRSVFDCAPVAGRITTRSRYGGKRKKTDEDEDD